MQAHLGQDRESFRDVGGEGKLFPSASDQGMGTEGPCGTSGNPHAPCFPLIRWRNGVLGDRSPPTNLRQEHMHSELRFAFP